MMQRIPILKVFALKLMIGLKGQTPEIARRSNKITQA
jgi:2-octaprenyl-6-methoxyphenol hydroxylase